MRTSHQRFFDAYQRCFGPLSVVRMPTTPSDMIVGPVADSKGWVEWKLIPCGLDLGNAFASLERQLNSPLPSSFKDWYSSFFTLDMDVSIIRLPSNPSNAPLQPMKERNEKPDPFDHAARSLGLIPFGDEAMMDAGPLCFDSRGQSDPERWPVTYWDHDWDGTDRQIGPPVFSCFEKLIECSTHYMNAFADVKPSRPQGSDHGLDDRGTWIRSMVQLDPDGAGGPGQEYWNCWIEES